MRDPFWEFYDLESDPLEVSNIYDDPSQQGRIKALKQTIHELRSRYGDDRDGLKFID